MAIAFVASTTAGNSSGTNVTINKPTGTADGDILIAVTYREAGTWTLPSGWAWLNSEQINYNGDCWVGLAWKRASSEPSSYTFNLSATTWRSLAIGAWRGCVASGDPVDVYASNNGPLLANAAASITTTADNTMLVVGTANYSGDDIDEGSSGMTTRAMLGGCGLFDEAWPTAGATGTQDLHRSAGGSGDWAAWHLALLPDVGAQTVNLNTIASTATVYEPAVTGGATPITHVGTLYSSIATGTALSWDLSTLSCQTGDLLVVFYNNEQASPGRTLAFTQDASGWTLAADGFVSGRAINGKIYWNTIDGTSITATTTVTATASASDEHASALVVLRNVDTTTPLSGVEYNSNGAASGDPVAVAKTGVDADDWVVFMGYNAYGTTYTAPTNWTEIADTRTATGSGNISLAVAYRTGVTSTSADTMNALNNDYWGSITFIVAAAPSAGPQTVNLDALASGATLYQVVVTPGAVTVSLNALASTATVHEPVVTQTAPAQTVTLNALSSTAEVYQPAVTVGAVAINLDALASTATVYQPAVTTGAVTVALNAIAAASTVYAPIVQPGAVTVLLEPIASTAAVYEPAVTTGAVTVALGTIASAATVHEPAVSQGGGAEQNVALNALDSVAEVYQPSVTVGAVTVALNSVTSTATVHEPAVQPGGVTVSLNAIASGAVVHQPEITNGTTVALNAIAGAATVHAVTVTPGPVTVSLGAIASGAVVHEPVVSTLNTVALESIASTALVHLPAVSVGAATVQLDTIASGAVVHEPSILTGASIVELNTIASSIVFYLPFIIMSTAVTPSVRRGTVGAEARGFVVGVDVRSAAVPAAGRAVAVSVEDRIHSVAAESRTEEA